MDSMASLEASLKLRDQFTAVLKTIDSALNHTTQTMSSFKQTAAGPAQALQQMATAAASAVSKMNSSIRSGLDVVMNVVRSTTERILTLFGNFGNQISTKLNLGGVTSKISSAFSGVTNKLSSVFSGLGKIAGSAFSSVTSAAKSFGSGVSSVFTSVIGHAKNFGSNLGNAFNGAKNSFKQFGHDLKSGFSGIKESTGQATNGVKSFVAAIGLMKAASAIVNTVKSSIDGAIDRFDTLNQFPKMMQAVGFSADQAASAKDKLVAGIDGLPTTLGEVVSTTQRIATMTKDLDGATKTTLALNNAFLASGSDSAKASQGLEQYIQMLGKGEVDMQSWRSLQDTMGVALNEVAESFGFAGRSAQNDLYKALQEGNITFDQFNNRIIEMSEATGGFAERALIGSEGIKTSFKNIRTAVTNGVEGSIRKIDSLVEKITGKNIAKNLDGVKQKVKDVFAAINGNDEKTGLLDRLPGMIEKVTPYVNVLKGAFNDLKGPIGDAINAVKKSLSELTGSFGSQKSVASFQSFVDGITESISKLAGFVEKHSDSIAKLISLLPKLAAAFIGFKIGKGVLSPFLTFGKGLTTVLSATGKLGGNLAGNFLSIFGFGKGKPGSDPSGGSDMGAKNLISPLNTFLNTMNGFAKGATNLALVFGVILLIKQAAQALKEVSEKIPDNLAMLSVKLGMMAASLAGMGVFVAAAGLIAKRNPSAAIAGLATVAALSGNIILAAEAMKQIDSKVPTDIASFGAKLGNMAIALGSMAAIVGIAGVLANLNPSAAVAGLVVVAALSVELILAAEAMKQVNNKVPSNIGDFSSKIANMAIAIGSLSLLAGIIGSVMATGIGGAIITAGLLAIAAVATDLILVAEAIQQVQNKVPDDLSGVKTKIDNIAEVIGYFSDKNLGNIFSVFSNAVGMLNTAVVVSNLSKFVEIGNAMIDLQTVVFSRTAVMGAIEDIQYCMDALTNGSFISKFGALANSSLDTGTTSNVEKILDTLIQIGNSFQKLELVLFTRSAVEKSILDIQSAIDLLTSGSLSTKLNNFIGSGFDSGTVNKVSETIDTLIKIGNQFVKLQSTVFSANAVQLAIDDLQKCIDMLTGGGLWDKLKNFFGSKIDTGTLNEVSQAIDVLIQIGQKFSSLQGVLFTPSAVQQSITAINDVIETIGTSSIGNWIGTMVKSSQLGEVVSTISQLTLVRDAIANFGSGEINTQGIEAAITAIDSVIQKLNTLPETADIGGLQNMIGVLQSLVSQFDAVVAATQASMTGMDGLSANFSSNLLSMQSNTTATMSAIQSAGTSGMAAFTSAIASGMAAASSAARAGNTQIVSAFSSLRSQLFSAGSYAMSGLTAGIQAGAGSAIAAAQSVASRVASTVRSALDIHSPSRVMMAIGGFVSEGLANGILAAQNLVQKASDALALATIPDQLATVAANGTVTSSVHVDDEDISRLKASTSSTVVVQHKQVVPQVTIHIDNKDGESIDEEALLQKFEDKVIELIDADLS